MVCSIDSAKRRAWWELPTAGRRQHGEVDEHSAHGFCRGSRATGRSHRSRQHGSGARRAGTAAQFWAQPLAAQSASPQRPQSESRRLAVPVQLPLSPQFKSAYLLQSVAAACSCGRGEITTTVRLATSRLNICHSEAGGFPPVASPARSNPYPFFVPFCSLLRTFPAPTTPPTPFVP